MKKYLNIIFLGSLFLLMAFVLPSTNAKAADTPTYEILDKTWNSITIKITFTTTSEYNRVELYNPYDSKGNSTSYNMYTKGTYTYTFKNLIEADAMYYLTIYYNDNGSELSERLIAYTAGVPQGKHVCLDLDYKKYLIENISYHNLKRWLNHLDKAYELFYDLVGTKPNNGKKINIVSSNDYKNYCMWTYPNTSTIYWNTAWIARGLRQIDREDDWHFGALHEIGHLFDLDGIWTFDSEFFANFKMAYVFYELDGNFRVKINDKIVTTYSDIMDFYYSAPGGGYMHTIGANPMKYSNDGLTYMFLNGIKKFGSWSSIKSTFRYLYEYGRHYDDDGAKFGEFMGIINAFTSKYNPFSVQFAEYYGDRYLFVEQHFKNKAKQRNSNKIIFD